MSVDALIQELANRTKFEQLRGQLLIWPGKDVGLRYGASSTAKATVRIPPGTQSLNVITTTGFTSLTITGATSGFVQASLSQYASAKSFSVPWNGDPDDYAQIAITTGSGQIGIVFASASPTPSPGITAQARGAAFASAGRGVGTYTFDVPPQSGYKGILAYIDVTAGAGTVTVSLLELSPSGNESSAQLTSTAIASPATGSTLRLYPGITVVANFTASDVVGQSPRIKAVVAGSSMTFRVDYDLIP